MVDLSGKVILITGAGMGIGREMSRLLAKEGARLVLWDIRRDALQETSKQIKDEYSSCEIFHYQCDVSDRFNVSETATKVLKDAGRVDVLINNAGIVSGGKLMDISDEQILRTFEINALAHFWTVRAFLPAMLEADSGHIVTISSAAGIVGASGMTDYSASKFACFGFNEALRLELKHMKKNIHTTVICPAYITTGMFEGYKTNNCLTPPLLPLDVAKEVVLAVKRKKYEVAMPQNSSIVYLMRLLPVSCFDWMMSCLGVSSSMDEFKGRGKDFSLARYKKIEVAEDGDHNQGQPRNGWQ